MKKNIVGLLPVLSILGLLLGFSSCKDDEPPAKPKLSFAETSMTVNEDDGSIEVELLLDRAYSQDITINYELAGTASDQAVVGTATADYEVDGDQGEVVIESGDKSAVIELDIYADGAFEPDETIEISITDVDSEDIEISADDEIEITITNDDEQVQISFASPTLTINEDDSDHIIELVVNLDKPAPGNLTLNYTLEGTALDSTEGFDLEIPASFYDYYIDGVAGELQVATGATTGIIKLRVYSDFRFENDETIIVTLAAPSSGALIGTNNKMTIGLDQQDGKAIALIWENAAYTDVDMDMFLWIGEDVNNLEAIFASSTTPNTKSPKEEIIFFPSALISNATIANMAFGLSYNYYAGTADPLNFEVHFGDFVDGVLEAEATREIYSATYTAANVNAWDNTNVLPSVVQTFKIAAGDIAEVSPITVPTSGSRVKTMKVPPGQRKMSFGQSRAF